MIRIQDASADDIAAFKQVVEASVRLLCNACYTPVQIAALLGHYPAAEVYRKWLSQRVLIVAKDGECVVGFAQFNPATASIEAMHVSPVHVGKGIGRRLTQCLEDKARALGFDTIRVVSSLNAAAFYAKCGYVAQARGVYRCNNGVELDAVPFEKQLVAKRVCSDTWTSC